jgi:hypothetical protein
MTTTSAFELFEPHVPINEWDKIEKVSIYYLEKKYLKWVSFLHFTWNRNFFLKVTYKDQTIKRILLSKDEKNIIKPCITSVNFHLSKLTFSY